MRPDPAFLVAIALAFCGIVAIVSGLLGQASLRRPTCRRCRADVRGRAWDADPTCDCGARLKAHNAVRFAGRARSRGAAITGGLLLITSVVITEWHLGLRAAGQTWRELLPASWEVANLRNGRDVNEALRSLMRRCDTRSIRPQDRSLAIDATLAATGARRDLVTTTLARLTGHPAMLEEPNVSATKRALAAIDASIAQRGPPTVRLPRRPGDPLDIQWLYVAPNGWSVVFIVDEIRRGGRQVAGRSVQWASGAMGERCDDSLRENDSLVISSREFRVPSNAAVALAAILFEGKPCPDGLVHSMVSRVDTVAIESSDGSAELRGSP